MYRAIIIDDDLIAINTLKRLIETYTHGLKIVASATEPEKAIALIKDYKPDVIFMDISEPERSFQLLESFTFKDFKRVFISSNEKHALKAIKNKAFDYLLKPVNIDELKVCIKNITDDLNKEKHPQKTNPATIIELPVKDGIIFIKSQNIIRLAASGSYTFFHLMNNVQHLASKNLKECEHMLDPFYFFRCHPSHIINLEKVEKLVSTHGLFASMTDGSKPEISRKNKDTFLEKLKNL